MNQNLYYQVTPSMVSIAKILEIDQETDKDFENNISEQDFLEKYEDD